MTLSEHKAFLFLLGLDVKPVEPSLECSIGRFLATGPRAGVSPCQSPERAGRTHQPSARPGLRRDKLFLVVSGRLARLQQRLTLGQSSEISDGRMSELKVPACRGHQ